MTNFEEIIAQNFGAEAIVGRQEGLMPILIIKTDLLAQIALFLHNDKRCFFDSLSCITAIDNGVESGTLAIVYNLYSIPHHHSLVLKVQVSRLLPCIEKVPSLSSIWHSANWDEREAYDMFGVEFDGHPYLQRILLPADWQGHPLRKDYSPQETYHGITVKY
jgi:NADH-quinone oxidoreductase subunit C